MLWTLQWSKERHRKQGDGLGRGDARVGIDAQHAVERHQHRGRQRLRHVVLVARLQQLGDGSGPAGRHGPLQRHVLAVRLVLVVCVPPVPRGRRPRVVAVLVAAVLVGGARREQREHRDAERPHVSERRVVIAVVIAAVDNLRRDGGLRATLLLRLAPPGPFPLLEGRQVDAQAEVGEHHVTWLAQQHVVELDVAVRDVAPVQPRDGRCELLRVLEGLGLRHAPAVRPVHVAEQVAAGRQLKGDAGVVAQKESRLHAQHVRAAAVHARHLQEARLLLEDYRCPRDLGAPDPGAPD
eukprot:scaffold14634_cov61-Phaeocystis_antarctica.AAC.8